MKVVLACIHRGFRSAALVAAVACGLVGCASELHRNVDAQNWRPSPNFDERRPNVVVLHHTRDNRLEDALRVLTDPSTGVSAHYLISREGVTYQLVDEAKRAWHAGVSSWGPDTDLNSSSIGIELDNNGEEPFSEPQINALLSLLADLKSRYRIPAANFIGHADVAPQRKVDPSRFFPWKTLATAGFGVWCDAPFEAAPSGFDATLGLAAFGYDVSDLNSTVRAFKLHFAPQDSTSALDAEDRDRLYCLLQKKGLFSHWTSRWDLSHPRRNHLGQALQERRAAGVARAVANCRGRCRLVLPRLQFVAPAARACELFSTMRSSPIDQGERR